MLGFNATTAEQHIQKEDFGQTESEIASHAHFPDIFTAVWGLFPAFYPKRVSARVSVAVTT